MAVGVERYYRGNEREASTRGGKLVVRAVGYGNSLELGASDSAHMSCSTQQERLAKSELESASKPVFSWWPREVGHGPDFTLSVIPDISFTASPKSLTRKPPRTSN